MPIRAIAVDIDGTVTDYEKRIDWAGIRALRRAESKGVPVAVATGNIAPVGKAFASFVGLTGPLIAENGGVVYSPDMRRRRLLADRRPAERAYKRLIKAGLPARPLWSDAWRVSEVALELNVTEDQVRRVLDGSDIDVVTTRFALHLMEPGLDKFNGLKAALPWIPTKPLVRASDVLAVGDSNNDVNLLRRCGHSGCVGNGARRARTAAQYVARRHHGAGVDEILRHFGI